MYKRHEETKGHYIGNSMGTINMFAAISKYENEMATYLHNVIMLAPCTVPNMEVSGEVDGVQLPEEFDIMRVYDYLTNRLGVYSYGGETWPDNVNTICELSFSRKLCYWARNLETSSSTGKSFKSSVHSY